MIRIVHPRPQAGRQKFIGIEFRDGFAQAESLHPEVEASLRQHGYAIENDDAAEGNDKASRRRTRGKADALVPANFTLNGAGFVAPDSVPLTLADLLLTAEVDDQHDVWLTDGALDVKIDGDWLPVNGAVLRTAPRIINGD